MRYYFSIILLLICFVGGSAQGVPQFDVTWNELGTDENCSMPLGNGDISANVWTEQNGDLIMLIGKTDAWSENALLYKVGQVRISMSPNPFRGEKIAQTLAISDARLTVKSAKGSICVWVDANLPVVRISTKTKYPTKITVHHEPWRTVDYHMTQEQINKSVFNYWEWRSNPNGIDFLADTILSAKKTSIAVCHFNTHSLYPIVLQREHLGELVNKYEDPLYHNCFGSIVSGKGFESKDNTTLASSRPSVQQYVNITVLTEKATLPEAWYKDVEALAKRSGAFGGAEEHNTVWKRHAAWWEQFWNRSWVKISGDEQAENVSKGYAMNRYMTAICGRGRYPIKFNGSILTVGHKIITSAANAAEQMAAQTAENHDPDFRDWGSCFWNQNIRHIYYPLTASGDYDLLMPWLDLYSNALPLAKDRTRIYYGHGGASFIETIHFWGLPNLMDFGWDNHSCDPQSGYMKWHTQGALEIIMTMLDYYDNTQDGKYLKEKLLPFAEAILTYYNEHWRRDADGKLNFDPHQSIEMYQAGCANPTPDIAGLFSVTERLLAIEKAKSLSALCQSIRRDLPAIPIGTTQNGKLPLRPDTGDKDGKPVILPAYVYGEPSNGENPELYTVFPYRNYCLGKPDLHLALNTFEARRYPFDNCWGQDGMEAALLGITDIARNATISSFTCYGNQKFPWFWRKVADYSPDMDNGGTGAMTLQLMLMQTNGREIRLIPAWPDDWTVDFKLHAPYNTTIEAHVENGKITKLNVTPKNREKDVVLPSSSQQNVIRVSCLGASITEGYGTSKPWSQNSYVGQMSQLLGSGYHVENYGCGGCTMIKKGEKPYWNEKQLQHALRSEPDVVFIDLGGNDAKLVHRIHKDDFVGDACELVRMMQALPSHPRIILMTAIPGFTTDSVQIWDTAIVRDINPRIIEAARQLKIEVLDMHPLLENHPELMPDGIHPNDVGAGIMARKMAWYLQTFPQKPSEEMTIDGVHYTGDVQWNSTPSSILHRASIRSFTGKPVGNQQIELLLRAGMAAPSCVNRQPWELLVLTDKETKERLVRGLGGNDFVKTAPVVIIPCVNLLKVFNGDTYNWMADLSAVSENILIAAQSLGLGGCWVGGWPNEERVAGLRHEFKLPNHIIPISILPIGYPAGNVSPKDKWKQEKVHWNQF